VAVLTDPAMPFSAAYVILKRFAGFRELLVNACCFYAKAAS